MLLGFWIPSPADSMLEKDAAKWLNLAIFPDVLLTHGKLTRVCILSAGWPCSLQGPHPPVSSSSG